MQSVETGLSNLLAQHGPELAAAIRSARNNDAFATAVRKTWQDSPEAADYLLARINAMQFEKDTAPRKGSQPEKPAYDLCVYASDSLTRAELNSRRELLVMMLAQEGIHFQSMIIRAATFGMKGRHLFPDIAGNQQSEQLDNTPQNAPASEDNIAEYASRIDDPALAERFKTAMTVTVGDPSSRPDPSNSWIGREGTDNQIKDESRLLETVKRAFCQAFGDYEQAWAVLEKVEGASLDEVRFNGNSRRGLARYRCHLYTSNLEQMSAVVDAYGDTIASCAKSLKLYLAGIYVHESPEPIKGHRAFPRSGNPVPLRAYKLSDSKMPEWNSNESK